MSDRADTADYEDGGTEPPAVLMSTTEAFVLDKTENPHPRMLLGALQARRTARALGGDRTLHYWAGYQDITEDWAPRRERAHNALRRWLRMGRPTGRRNDA